MVEGFWESGAYNSLSTQDCVSPEKGISNGINNGTNNIYVQQSWLNILVANDKISSQRLDQTIGGRGEHNLYMYVNPSILLQCYVDSDFYYKGMPWLPWLELEPALLFFLFREDEQMLFVTKYMYFDSMKYSFLINISFFIDLLMSESIMIT